MRKLILEETKNTPEIILDPNKGYFSFKGKSFPENSKKFYETIMEWFNQFEPQVTVSYKIDFELHYISSASIISIFEILKKLSKLQKAGAKINIYWMYESDDEDIRKIGEDFTKLVDIPIELKAVEVQ